MNSKANLYESVDVSNGWNEIRNKRHKTIFQLYVLSSISVVLKQLDYYNLQIKSNCITTYKTKTKNISQNCKQNFNCLPG